MIHCNRSPEVGLAFNAAYKEKPGIILQKPYDGSQPDLPGTYLAACVVYSSVYEKSPVGNSYNYFGPIEADMATFLQTVAGDTVSSFYGW